MASVMAIEANPRTVTRWATWLMPSLEGVIGIFIFLMVLSDGNRLFHDTDPAWHIATGDYILANWEVPKHDIFSHRMYGQTWIAHEWLSDVIFAVLHKVYGFNGIVVLSAYLISVTFVILFKTLSARKLNILIVTVVTILAALTSYVHWLARPHLFTLCLTVIWHTLLESHQAESKKFHYFLFPILLVIWANLHGGYVLGLALIGVYALGNILNCMQRAAPLSRRESVDKALSLGLIGVLCVLAALVNPYGYRLLLFPFETLGASDVNPYIPEWQSISFREISIYQIYFLSVVMTLLMARQKLDAVQLILIALTVHMFFSAKRYIPIFAVLMAPALGRSLNTLYEGGTSSQSLDNLRPLRHHLLG